MVRIWQRMPSLIFYLPYIPYIFFLAIRYRISPIRILFINPAFLFGGAFTYSKIYRLNLFKAVTDIVTSIPCNKGNVSQTLRKLTKRNIAFPLLIKPDNGLMSKGVSKVDDRESLEYILRHSPIDYIIQPYINEPLEFSILYYRIPGNEMGDILDICERQLPSVIGDGVSNIYQLIIQNKMYSEKEIHKFFKKEILTYIPTINEKKTLLVAANSKMGAKFLSANHLKTSKLVKYFNTLANEVDGFYYGKIDLKVKSIEDFIECNNLHIIEINGSVSEINSLFDSNISFPTMIKLLRQQFGIMFKIGSCIRAEINSYSLLATYEAFKKSKQKLNSMGEKVKIDKLNG